MKTVSYSFANDELIQHSLNEPIDEAKVQLVLCFGARHLLETGRVYELLRENFPAAEIAMCSTAGEIYHTSVLDDSLTVTAIQFDRTSVTTRCVDIASYTDSYQAGKSLLEEFDRDGLSYVLVLSDGSRVNGSELVRGMNEATENKILVTGGLAGDGSDFQSTVAGLNSEPKQGLIVAIGFYGKHLEVNHGSRGGWEMFGLEKEVTRSESNVLFEIENKKALEIYKQYLGPEANSLPGSALLFPLAVKLPGQNEPIVRTILSIDEAAGSMTFAGDIPQGAKVRFMKANFDKLTAAASGAAQAAVSQEDRPPKLALLISCVGRKLILQSRTEEEVEAISEVFGEKTLLTGFYSYGEISPLVNENGCQLHNQTMTITTFDETE